MGCLRSDLLEFGINFEGWRSSTLRPAGGADRSRAERRPSRGDGVTAERSRAAVRHGKAATTTRAVDTAVGC